MGKYVADFIFFFLTSLASYILIRTWLARLTRLAREEGGQYDLAFWRRRFYDGAVLPRLRDFHFIERDDMNREMDAQTVAARLLALGGTADRHRIRLTLNEESREYCLQFFSGISLGVGDILEVDFGEWVDPRDEWQVTADREEQRAASRRAASEAEEKGRELLGQLLGADELRRYQKIRRVLVKSKRHPNHGYLISAANSTYFGKLDMLEKSAEAMALAEYEPTGHLGRSIKVKCIVVREAPTLPEADQVLNLALLCQADEEKFWAIGIEQGLRGLPPGRPIGIERWPRIA